jgi:hypothetical protein
LLYNGAYTDIDGTKLSGWTVYEGDGSYGSGYIERDGVIKYPFDSVRNEGVSSPLTSELLQLDTYEAANDGAAGPVRSNGVMTDGHIYIVTISGTLSLWNSSAWSSICKGVPSDWPEEPSPGTTNGKVGLDAGFIFAVPSVAAALCASPDEPPIQNWSRGVRLELSLDDGESWSPAAPLYERYNPSHVYEYVVEGQGDRIQFRWVDSTTSNNYGMLAIRVEIPSCDLSRQPVVLIPGWEGSGLGLKADDQLALVAKALRPDYAEGCNLFYAADLSPSQTLRESAEAVQASLRAAYTGSVALDSTWNGHLDVIAYGYGGLSARAYLESDLYVLDLARTEHVVRIDNLFTLGAPHGGGVSVMPGAAHTTAEQRPTGHWVSLWQMTPWQMQVWSDLYTQPDGVCYRVIGGDGFEQDLPWWLDLWYSQLSSMPNDLGVYRWSSQGMTLGEDHYPRLVASDTPDLHNHTDRYGLGAYSSYVSPADTVDTQITPYLGAPQNQCAPSAPAARGMSSIVGTEPVVPSVLISAGEVSSGALASGSYYVHWTGPSVAYLNWLGGELDLELTDPTGCILNPGIATLDPDVEYVEMDAIAHTVAYVFSTTLTGTWGYTLTGASLPYTMPYRLFAVPSSHIGITAQASPWQALGQPAIISAEVTYSATAPIVGAVVQALVTGPAGDPIALSLYDDGAHSDLAADDGVYGNTYTDTSVGGFYAVVVEAAGLYASEPFTRTSETYFSVSTGAISLSGIYGDQPRDPNGDGKYDWLDVTVGVTATQAGTYMFAADLFAVGQTYIGHSMLPFALSSGSEVLTLTFDGNDIRASGLDGPYTITNLLIANEEFPHLLMDRADWPHTTAAYAHQEFGRPRLYLPTIMRGK